jgi:hypothetical protein
VGFEPLIMAYLQRRPETAVTGDTAATVTEVTR